MKFMIVLVGILTILGGLLPFLAQMNLIPAYIPVSGVAYQGLIIALGVIGVIYGFRQQRYDL